MTIDAHAPAARATTDVDRIANGYLDALVELRPITATYLGIPGHDEDLDDFSPAGLAAQSGLRIRTLDAVAQATPDDDVDRATIAAMTERLGLAEETYARRSGPDVPHRAGLPTSGSPRDLRPDAHRHRVALDDVARALAPQATSGTASPGRRRTIKELPRV